MSKHYFNRLYSLTFGYPAKVMSTGFGETVFEAGKAKTVSGLRIAFDISKTETSESNSCTIIINNLSESTRKFIRPRTSKNEGMIVTLRAGYEEMQGAADLPGLFIGDITSVSHDTTNPEVVTTLECHDGYVSIKTSRFSKSYLGGGRVAQIISDIIAELDLPMQATYQNAGLPDYKLNNGFSFDGLASDALTRICKWYGLRWSVQNNAVKIYRKKDDGGKPGNDDKLPCQSVLIGSPKRVIKEMKGISGTDFRGYDFQALLMPGAEPGGKVSITSKNLPTGTVTLAIAEVHHKGDTHGIGPDSWTTTIKARDL